MSRLVEILESLKLDDGSPDILARKTELSALSRYLSDAEVQDLRVQLNARKVPNDPCRKLPIEIMQEIASYLDLEELIRAREVSKSWLNIIGGRDISAQMLILHFPWTRKRNLEHISKTEQVLNQESPQENFLIQAKQWLRRKNGYYHSITTYKPNDLDRLHYCNRRIAFSHNAQDAIHVWSLQTDDRRVYMDANREPMNSSVLSEALLIYEKQSPSRLVVWNLNLPESAEPMVIHCPSSIKGYSACLDQIAIFLDSDQVLICKWGGPLIQVNTDSLKEISASSTPNLELFFHPYDTGIIFIANTFLKQLTSRYVSVIAEYILVNKEWKCKTTHEMSYSHICVHDRHRPKRVTAHQSQVGMLSIISALGDDHHCGEKVDAGSLCEYASFDMLTGDIKKYTYRIPEWVTRYLDVDDDIHISHGIFNRDQVLLCVYQPESESGSEVVPLVAISSSPEDASQSASLPILSRSKSEDGRELTFGSFKSWARGRISLLPDYLGDERFGDLDGDEDFIVLSGWDEIMILCFDESVVVPEYNYQRETSEDT